MNHWKSFTRPLLALLGIFMALVVAGCASTGGSGDGEGREDLMTSFRPGEALIITFADTPMPIQPFEGRIKEDGSITLMENQDFAASGKTAGQLEKEIRDRYVPRYFTKLTVTVKSQDRFFYVIGEVRMPGRYEYRGDITLSGAIAAAGGFTVFARKTKVRITRANNRTVTVDVEKAINTSPELDVAIFPGDRIQVPKKVW